MGTLRNHSCDGPYLCSHPPNFIVAAHRQKCSSLSPNSLHSSHDRPMARLQAHVTASPRRNCWNCYRVYRRHVVDLVDDIYCESGVGYPKGGTHVEQVGAVTPRFEERKPYDIY